MPKFGQDLYQQKRQINSVIKKINKFIATGIENTDAILQKNAIKILETSQKLCPIDTGKLRASAFVKKTTKSTASAGVGAALSKNPTYTVGYSAANMSGNFIIRPRQRAHYAVFVHEDLAARHDGMTQAKFLEDAFNIHRTAIIGEIKKKAFKRPPK